MPKAQMVVGLSLLWFLIAFAAIFVESLENWAHRVSSFVGFLLCTVEGILGLLGVGGRPGLLAIALLHGLTFVLAVMGRYQARQSRRRPRRSLEELAEQALSEAEKQGSSNDDSL